MASSDVVGAATGADWGYVTEPGRGGRCIAAVRGKVLGGSSAVNAAVAVRPRPQDLRNWDLPGWSFDDLLPALRRLEDSASPDEEIHGAGDQASAGWRWTVWRKAGQAGIVSTGTYEDRFERRHGVWKCLERTSRADPN